MPNVGYKIDEDENMDIDEKYKINATIYLDCYSSYKDSDFLDMGYMFKGSTIVNGPDKEVFLLIILKDYDRR